MNPKHYTSDAECAKCKGRLRYRSTQACVPCAKVYVAKTRARVVPAGTTTKVQVKNAGWQNDIDITDLI